MSREKQIEEMAIELYEIVNARHGEASMRELSTDLYTAGYRKQRKGEWIWDREHSNHKCSLCGEYDIGKPKFCRACGAHMRKEGYVE